MIHINLLGHEPAKPKRRKSMPDLSIGGSENITFAIAIVGTLLLLAAAWWFQTSRLSRLQATMAELEVRRAELADTAAQVNEVEDRTAMVNQKLDVIVDLKRGQTGPLMLLDHLSQELPDSLWLSQLDAQQGSIAITGSALSNVAVSDFVRNLRLSPYFDVDEQGGLRFTEDTGDAFRFQINALFLPQVPTVSDVEAEPGEPAQ
jgi:type IV pilus assembly protein PilN